MVRPPSRALMFTPFSLCRLPVGTTRLEFVTSGRSVAISSLAVGQASARASTAPKIGSAGSKHSWKVRLSTGWLQINLLLSGQESDERSAASTRTTYTAENSDSSVEKGKQPA